MNQILEEVNGMSIIDEKVLKYLKTKISQDPEFLHTSQDTQWEHTRKTNNGQHRQHYREDINLHGWGNKTPTTINPQLCERHQTLQKPIIEDKTKKDLQVTLSSLYTNIPHDEDIAAIH